MSTTNRAWNRILLAAVGLAWLAAAAVLAVWALGIDVLAWLPEQVRGPVASLDVAVVACVAAVLALVVWALHLRFAGGGRTDDAVRAGQLVLDRALVADVVDDALSRQPDVLRSSIDTWLDPRGGLPTWRVTIDARVSGELPRLLDDVSAAIESARARLGVRAIALVHVRSGIRTAMATARRAR